MTRPRIVTEAQLASIFAWRRAGKSYEFIARRINCSSSTVAHQCRLHRIRPIDAKPIVSHMPMVVSRGGIQVRRFTPEDDRIALAMHAAGTGPTEIGRALGRSTSSVCQRLTSLKAQAAAARQAA